MLLFHWTSLVAQTVKTACNAGDPGSVLALGRCPGEGNGNPVQDSCLGNSIDRGAWLGYSPWGLNVGYNLAAEHTHRHDPFPLEF